VTVTTNTNNTKTMSGRTASMPPMVPRGRLAAPTRRQRRFPFGVIAGLVAALVGFGLLNVMLLSATSHRQPYLAMAHSVSAGQIIGPGDLMVVDLAGAAALNAVPASQRSQIVGRPAAVSLTERTLVPRGIVGAPHGLTASQALVALGLKAGQYPPGLREGDHVMVIATGTAAAGTQASGTQSAPADDAAGVAVVPDARVMAVTAAAPGSGSDEVVVSVGVDATAAPAVAGAASVGKASLVLLGGGR
jgi:hypothetical protein